MLVWASFAFAVPLVAGERLTWSVRWMGAEAGTASATTAADGDGWRIQLNTRSASWVDALYPIDDELRSSWLPGGGSRTYDTRFREGRFHEDLAMRFGAAGIDVVRNKEEATGWTRTESHFDPSPGVEDPLSALWRLRTLVLDGDLSFPVFTGRRVMTVHARVTGVETVADTEAWRVVIGRDSHELEDVDGRLQVWISTDDRRVPVQAAVRTKAGTVTAVLTGRQTPG